MRVYLDNASTTPLSQTAINAMIPMMQEQFGNPSSIHAEGRKVRAAIEAARKTVANALNASIGEIFFTSGGTESNNMALKCSVRDLGVKRIISSPIEHHCVLHTLESLQENQGIEVVLLAVNEYGEIDLAELENVLQASDAKTLVSIMHANNEIGTLLDLPKVSKLCETHGAYLHSDSVQTMTHYPIDVDAVKVHFLSAGAHKFHGPKGCGFIYINSDAMIKPYLDGGAQERNMRGGTENVYGIAGLAAAFSEAIENMDSWRSHIQGIRRYLIEELDKRFEGLIYNSRIDQPSLYTVLSVSFPPSEKSELLLLSLDIAGVSVSGGSACSSGSEKGSHVIEALKRSPDRKTIRFSFSHHNTKEEIDFAVAKLEEIIPSRITA